VKKELVLIFNIEPGTFGGRLRMGDLVGVCNVVEHLRKINNNTLIQFHIKINAISEDLNCIHFYFWLIKNTSYFTATEGTETLPWKNVNVWDFRDISGDLVKIPNKFKKQKKIVVCPLLDAPYNTYRNWTDEVFNNIIAEYDKYPESYEKVIISKKPMNLPGWKDSSDILVNLNHIMTAEIYVGGDTGLSHFAGALEKGPNPVYYTSSRGLLHTTPINWMTKKKGTMKTYWLDFEGTKWG
jgi:hypothetical protein